MRWFLLPVTVMLVTQIPRSVVLPISTCGNSYMMCRLPWAYIMLGSWMVCVLLMTYWGFECTLESKEWRVCHSEHYYIMYASPWPWSVVESLALLSVSTSFLLKVYEVHLLHIHQRSNSEHWHGFHSHRITLCATLKGQGIVAGIFSPSHEARACLQRLLTTR